MNFSLGNETLAADFSYTSSSIINSSKSWIKTSTIIPSAYILSPQHQQTNFTDNVPPPTIPPIVMTTIFVFNGLLAMIGIAGNAVVCLIIVRGRKMYTIANLFLMNLAIADMCVLVVSYPLWVLQTVAPSSWPFGTVLCKVIPSVSDAFYGVSLGCMTAISIHRYRMILHAVGKQITFTHSKIIILTIWIISIASISAPLFPVKQYRSDGTDTSCLSKWPSRSYERSYQLFLFIFWYVCPLLIILFTFLRIKLYLEKQMQYNWLKGSEHTMLVANHITGIRKALRMLAPVVIVFAILMLPWNIIRLVSFFTEYHLIDDIQIYIAISGTMLVANSVSNPFIYYIKSKEFRLEFQKQFWFFKVKLGIKPEHDEEGRFVIKSNHHGRVVVRRAESFLIENDTHHQQQRSRTLTIMSDVSPSFSSTNNRSEMNDRFTKLYNNNGQQKNEEINIGQASPNFGQVSPSLLINHSIASKAAAELYMIEEEEHSHDLDYPFCAVKPLVEKGGVSEANFYKIISKLRETNL